MRVHITVRGEGGGAVVGSAMTAYGAGAPRCQSRISRSVPAVAAIFEPGAPNTAVSEP